MSQLATLPVGTERFVIRRATADDVAAIVALLSDDEIGAGREDVSAAGLAPYRRAFAVVDADPRQLLLVVTTGDGSVAATMQLTFIAGLSRQGALRAQVEAVRVSSCRRSRGLGEAMITWAIAEARRRGCALVQLTSDKQREGALRFYSRLGFTPSHEGFKLLL
jgi:ribosomal protein S18 acetylase RimI-like enzyme